jgi:hypothetical protein
MNLVELRTRVRQDLQDTAAPQRWTDAEIDAAIQRVVDEYSIHAPQEMQTDIPTTTGSQELPIATLAGLIRIESVEFPIGAIPPHRQTFDHWAGRLYMDDFGNGQPARVRWLRRHTLDAVSTTIPTTDDEIIVLGATGYLAMSASAFTVDRATISGRFGTTSYKLWGKERLDRYDKKLKAISRSSRHITRQMFTDD